MRLRMRGHWPLIPCTSNSRCVRTKSAALCSTSVKCIFEKVRKRPDLHPIVTRTLESIRARDDAAKRPKPPPLFRPDDFLADAPKAAKPTKAGTSEDAAKRGLRVTPKLVRRKKAPVVYRISARARFVTVTPSRVTAISPVYVPTGQPSVGFLRPTKRK